MLWSRLKTRLARYRADEGGTVMIEAVIALPILMLAIASSYEFFEVHRYQSAREKATYTVADMLSREQAPVTAAYIDNAKTLFDAISNDSGTNQLRVSVVTYFGHNDTYVVSWSEVRGQGSMNALTNADLTATRGSLPILRDGEELILVEAASDFQPVFTSLFTDGLLTTTRVFTSLRFAPQLCFVTCNA